MDNRIVQSYRSEKRIMRYNFFKKLAENNKETTARSDYFSKPAEPSNKEQELATDLKEMELDDLLFYIPPEILEKNLRKICCFVRGTDTELEFHDVPKCLEELLVRIVKDVDVLKSIRNQINSCSRIYVNQIVDIVKEEYYNKKFMLACVHKKEPRNPLLEGLGVKSQNTLVYNKIYFTQMNEKIVSISQHLEPPHTRSLSSTPPLSRSTSVDSLVSQRSNLQTLSPTLNHFQTHCLELILQFIKDKTQTRLEFSNLSPDDARLLYILFSSVIDNNYDNGLGGKNFCTAIWEAVKIFSSEFEFHIRYLDNREDTKSLLLEKISKKPKFNPNSANEISDSLLLGETSKEPQVEIDSENEISEPTVTKTKKEQKREKLLGKRLIKKKKIIDPLRPEFVIHTLRKLINFFSDDLESSVLFSSTDVNEKRFINDILNISRSHAIRGLFNDENRRLLEKLAKLIDLRTFKLSIKGTKRNCGETGIKFSKLPNFDNAAMTPTCRQWYPRVEKPKSSVPSSGISNAKRKEMLQFVPGFHHGFQPQYSILDFTGSPSTSYDREPEVRRKRARQSNINFQSTVLNKFGKGFKSTVLQSEKDPILLEMVQKYANATMIFEQDTREAHRTSSPGGNPYKRCRSKEKQRPMPMRQEQLIEALSVPVTSDKAMRIMKSMGWEGGALGSRGQGITEPIMPHFSKGYGAGLGHGQNKTTLTKLKPQPITPAAPAASAVAAVPAAPAAPAVAAVRAAPTVPTAPVLPAVPAAPTLCVSNNKKLSMKFRLQFLKQLLELLTSDYDTKTLHFHPAITKREKGFVFQAMTAFSARRKLAMIKEDQPLVEQVLEHYKQDPELIVAACVSNDRKRMELSKLHSLGLHISQREKLCIETMNEPVPDNIKLLLDTYRNVCQSERAFEITKFKAGLLMDVLKFVNESAEKTVFQFPNGLNKKQRSYIESTLRGINRKTVYRAPNPELVLLSELRRRIGNFIIKIKFADDNKSISATKEPFDRGSPQLSGQKSLDRDKSTNGKSERLETECLIDELDTGKDTAVQRNSNEINAENNNVKDYDEIYENIDDEINSGNDIDTDETALNNDKLNTSDENMSNTDIVDGGDNICDKVEISVANIDDFNENIENIVGTNNSENMSEKDNVIDNNEKNLEKSCIINEDVEITLEASKSGVNITDRADMTGDNDYVNENDNKDVENIVVNVVKQDDSDVNIIDNGEIVKCNVNLNAVTDNIMDRLVEMKELNNKLPENDEKSTANSIEQIPETNSKSKFTATSNNIDKTIPGINPVIDMTLHDNEDNDDNNKNITNLDDKIFKEPNIEEVVTNDNGKISHNSTFNDIMSISDHSACTANLDCSDNDDIFMIDEKNKTEGSSYSEMSLELSFNSETMLSVDSDNVYSDYYIKIVILSTSNFSIKDIPIHIQGLISMNIEKAKVLPLLNCHGVKNGALIYSCHNKETFDWLNTVCVANNISIIIKECDKMRLKLNSVLDFDHKYLFKMLKLYNKELSTNDWLILKKEIIEDCVIFYVKMDKKSFMYIVESNLALYAGVDKVTFNIIWE